VRNSNTRLILTIAILGRIGVDDASCKDGQLEVEEKGRRLDVLTYSTGILGRLDFETPEVPTVPDKRNFASHIDA
jgi:hypothetical protein